MRAAEQSLGLSLLLTYVSGFHALCPFVLKFFLLHKCVHETTDIHVLLSLKDQRLRKSMCFLQLYKELRSINSVGHRCRRCHPFFYEFRESPSVNIFKLVCCVATTYTTDAKSRGLALIDVLFIFTWGGEWGAMVCFVMQARKSQGCVAPAAQAEASVLKATINFSCWYTALAVFLSSPALQLCMACSQNTNNVQREQAGSIDPF
jgi:hypothetical protein